QEYLNSVDFDLGSGGPLLLPNEAGGAIKNQHLIVGASKEGTIYLINRDNMSHYNPLDDSMIVQSIPYALGGGCFDTPAYFNNTIYFLGIGDVLKAFVITNGHIITTPASQGPTVFGYPGATPSVSANGTNDGIVWALQSDAGTAVLRAYNATNVALELY